MELITRSELAALNQQKLRGLLRTTYNELAKSDYGTHQRHNALV